MTLLLLTGLSLGPTAMASDAFFVSTDRGPVKVLQPTPSVEGQALPLIVLLHGYGGHGMTTAHWMGFPDAVDSQRFVLVAPDGNVDPWGSPYWNATDACCDFAEEDPDDVGYLVTLIEDIEARVNIDPDRIFVTGYSNGGFMSHRLACERSDKIAAIAALSGTTWNDPAMCMPTEPIHVLQIHGVRDTVIHFNGGCDWGPCYPGVLDTINAWATLNNCTGSMSSGWPLNIEDTLAGPETRTARNTSCDPNGSVHLWTNAGTHYMDLGDNYSKAVVRWLTSHGR